MTDIKSYSSKITKLQKEKGKKNPLSIWVKRETNF